MWLNRMMMMPMRNSLKGRQGRRAAKVKSVLLHALHILLPNPATRQQLLTSSRATAHPMQSTSPLPNLPRSNPLPPPPPPPRQQPSTQPTPRPVVKPNGPPRQQPPALGPSQAPDGTPQPKKKRGRPPKNPKTPVPSPASTAHRWPSVPMPGQPMLPTQTPPEQRPTLPWQHQQMHTAGLANDPRFGNFAGGNIHVHGMPPTATDYASPSSQPPRVPRPPAQSVLPTQTAARTFPQPAAGAGVLGVSTGCVVCRQDHANLSCINMNSVMDLRIAVDMLRNSRADPAYVQELRQRFQSRIRELNALKEAR